MTTAEKYVFAAYTVVLAVVLLWVLIYASKVTRLQREVSELVELAARRREPQQQDEPERQPVT